MDNSLPFRSYTTLNPDSHVQALEAQERVKAAAIRSILPHPSGRFLYGGTVIGFLALAFVGNLIFPFFMSILLSTLGQMYANVLFLFVSFALGLKFGEVATLGMAIVMMRIPIVLRVLSVFGIVFVTSVLLYAGMLVVGFAPIIVFIIISILSLFFLSISACTTLATSRNCHPWIVATVLVGSAVAIMLIESFVPKIGPGGRAGSMSTPILWAALMVTHLIALIYVQLQAFKQPKSKAYWAFYVLLVLAGPYLFLNLSFLFFRLMRLSPNLDGLLLAYSFTIGFLLVNAVSSYLLVRLGTSQTETQSHTAITATTRF